MGIESREWYREGYTKKRKRSTRRSVVAGAALGIALLLAMTPPVSSRLGYTPPFGTGNLFTQEGAEGELRLRFLPGTGGLTIREHPLYPANDPWAAWLADEVTCPRGEDASAPVRIQAQVFLCLANYARAREGLHPLSYSPLLSSSATAKAVDIVRCDDFDHDACGRRPDQAALDVGYRAAFGENLYVGEPPLTAPRIALDRWLNSPGHRLNLFRPEWRVVGVALVTGDLTGYRNAVVWVNHFGT